MAIYYLDPNNDVKADMTEVPPGPSWSTLDDGARAPDGVPDLSDYNTSSAHNGQFVSQVMGPSDIGLPDNERVIRARTVLYADFTATGDATFIHWLTTTVGVSAVGSPSSTPGTQIPVGGPAWSKGVVLEREFSDGEVNGLQIWTLHQMTTGTSTVNVYAAYVEIETALKSGQGRLLRAPARLR